MTETTLQPDVRPVHDIEEDIRRFIRSYDPLKQARPYFVFDVGDDGFVTLSGHVRSVQARRVLVDNIPDLEGITGCDAEALYDDETLRLTIGAMLPRGVMLRVNFGHVVLYGHVPADLDTEALVAQVRDVPGIIADTIATKFY